MTLTNLTLELPDALAREAQQAGLCSHPSQLLTC